VKAVNISASRAIRISVSVRMISQKVSRDILRLTWMRIVNGVKIPVIPVWRS
jgi:hypothetical protein